MVYMQKQTKTRILLLLPSIYYIVPTNKWQMAMILYKQTKKTDKSLGILLLSSLAPYVLLISHQLLQLLQ